MSNGTQPNDVRISEASARISAVVFFVFFLFFVFLLSGQLVDEFSCFASIILLFCSGDSREHRGVIKPNSVFPQKLEDGILRDMVLRF